MRIASSARTSGEWDLVESSSSLLKMSLINSSSDHDSPKASRSFILLAARTATSATRKNLNFVALKKETIYYETTGRHGASKVFMRPAADGTGIIAGGAMRAVFECVGIRNILAKSFGSRNPINLVKATINALEGMQSPKRVARRRGIPLTKILS